MHIAVADYNRQHVRSFLKLSSKGGLKKPDAHNTEDIGEQMGQGGGGKAASFIK